MYYVENDLDFIVDELDKIANGGMKHPGKAERIGEIKTALRELRDIGRAALAKSRGPSPFA